MKCAVLLPIAVLAVTAYGVTVEEEWKILKVEHKTQYLPERESTAKPEHSRARNKAAQHKIAQEIWHMSDKEGSAVSAMNGPQRFNSDDLPSEINWVLKGAVTPIKDQYKQVCKYGGWAFSAAGALEGQYFIHKSKKLASLSAQHLIDCSDFYGNEGCTNGTAARAFAYVAGSGRLAVETSYPFQGFQAQCRIASSYYNLNVSGVFTTNTDETELQRLVAQSGPASAAIYSSPDSFQRYRGGVYYDKNCSFVAPEQLNHEVLVVGYGTEQPGGDYWWIKNSWGLEWGIQGYMKLARNRGNHCGIGHKITYPMLA